MSTAVVEAIQSAFDDGQKTVANHNRCVRNLWKSYRKAEDDFPAVLVKFLDYIFAHPDNSPAIFDRLIRLVANISCKNARKYPQLTRKLAMKIVRHCLERTRAKDKNVRLRATRLLTSILHAMPDDFDLNDDSSDADIFEKMAEALCSRSIDQVASVRTASMSGLARLQNPNDSKDIVTQAIIRAIEDDSSKDVRLAALKIVGIHATNTLPVVVRKARDVSDQVRVMAYKTIKEKVPLRVLSMQHKIELLRFGLKDRSQVCKNACTELCLSWLEEEKGSIIGLLKGFGPIEYAAECELLVESLLAYGWQPLEKERPVASLLVSANSKLSLEMALLWHMMCRHQFETRGDAEGILPDAVKFCRLLDSKFLFEAEDAGEAHVQRARHLIATAAYLDMQDEVGRQAICSAARDMTRDLATPHELLPKLVDLLKKTTWPQTSVFVNAVLEVISDIRDEATALSSAIDTGASLPWKRVLGLVVELLQHPAVSFENAGLSELLHSSILPLLAVQDPILRELALRALGLTCLLNRRVAKEYVGILLKVMLNDIAQVQTTALKAIMDVVIVHNDLLAGSEDNEKKEEAKGDTNSKGTNLLAGGDQPTVTSIDELAMVLTNLMQDQSEDLRGLAVEGLEKLFLAERTTDPYAMAQLLVKYIISSDCNPRESQSLAVFFSAYLEEEEDDDEDDDEQGRTSKADAKRRASSIDRHRRVVARALPYVVMELAEIPKKLKKEQVTITKAISFLVKLVNFRAEDAAAAATTGGGKDSKHSSSEGKTADATSTTPLSSVQQSSSEDMLEGTSLLFQTSIEIVIFIYAAIDNVGRETKGLFHLLSALPLGLLPAGRATIAAACLRHCDKKGRKGGARWDKQTEKYIKTTLKILSCKGEDGVDDDDSNTTQAAAVNHRKWYAFLKQEAMLLQDQDDGESQYEGEDEEEEEEEEAFLENVSERQDNGDSDDESNSASTEDEEYEDA